MTGSIRALCTYRVVQTSRHTLFMLSATQEPRKRKSSSSAARATNPADRLLWRAVVRTGRTFAASRLDDRIEWHLAACDGDHCEDGARGLEEHGNPHGHCVVDGACPLCAKVAA